MTWTILNLLNWCEDYFKKNGIPTPRLDAEVLLAHVLGCERIQLYIQFERPLTGAELAPFKGLVKRRIAGEPVAYIRGVKEFWSLPFKVGPGVMIPRPDTECLVEAVCRIGERKMTSESWVASGGELPPVRSVASTDGIPPDDGIRDSRHSGVKILDIGTGSGNIAIALAKEFSDARVTAIDISAGALEYAHTNAVTNHVEDRIVFERADFTGLDVARTAHFDIIVSNPPYIKKGVLPTLGRGITDYEPQIALDGGKDGLDFYRHMGQIAPRILNPGGLLAVEIGEDQGISVMEIFAEAGLTALRVSKDYAHCDRVVTAWTKSSSKADGA